MSLSRLECFFLPSFFLGLKTGNGLSHATTTGETIAGRIRSRAISLSLCRNRSRRIFTYTWIWLSGPPAAAVVSLCLAVLLNPAADPFDHLEVDLDFCSESHIGIVGGTAADRRSGHLIDRSLAVLDDMYPLRMDRVGRIVHIGRLLVENSPSSHSSVPLAHSHSRKIVLHHSTNHLVVVVLDIGLEMVAAACAGCTGYEP